MSASKLSLELAKPRDLGAYVLQQLALPKPIHQTEAENRGGGGGQWPGSARGSYRGENLLLKELLSCLGGDPGSREAGAWGVPRRRDEARAVRLCRCRPRGAEHTWRCRSVAWGGQHRQDGEWILLAISREPCAGPECMEFTLPGEGRGSGVAGRQETGREMGRSSQRTAEGRCILERELSHTRLGFNEAEQNQRCCLDC